MKLSHAVLEVFRHEFLERIAVHADQLPEETDRQKVLPLGLLFDDDLGQDRARDVVAGLRVVDHEINVVADHAAQVVQGDVAAGRRVVEAPVGVFLDDDLTVVPRLFPAGHGDAALLHIPAPGRSRTISKGKGAGPVSRFFQHCQQFAAMRKIHFAGAQ